DRDRQALRNLAALAAARQRARTVVVERDVGEVRAVLTITPRRTVLADPDTERLRATVRHRCNEISVAIDEQILDACAISARIACRTLRAGLTLFAGLSILTILRRREFRHFFLHAKFDHRLQFFGVEQHAPDITRIDLR